MSSPTDPSDGGVTRRAFLKTTGGSVLLLVTPVPLDPLFERAVSSKSQFSAQETVTRPWSGSPGSARYRIEGLAKVTGQKIYARDFRARDMAGWPDTERAALVLRARYADRPFLGLDLLGLVRGLRNFTVIDAERLARDHIRELFPDRSPVGRPGGMFVPRNQVPVYRGQPLAILILEDVRAYRAAVRLLQFNPDAVRYGEPVQVPPVTTPYSPPTYLTRYAVEPTDFSQVKDGPANPYSSAKPVDREAATLRARIAEEMQTEGWRLFHSSASTQRLDPMFMEPESGLGWYEAERQTMHLVLGTQSTNGDVRDGTQLFADPNCPINVGTVHLTSCYPGGGFGGRDESPFSPLVMLAAVYAGGPVRVSRDRFEQFQAGIKQPGAEIEQTLAIDSDGHFQAIHSVLQLKAGGKNNYSQFVAALAGYSAGGGYRFPRVAVDATAQPSDGVVAGSMRGFGGPQAAFALETLIDEAADTLSVDAIDLRRSNALRDGDLTITGAPPEQPLRIVEILNRARANPLWTERESEKRRRATQGSLYGVGFALANQAYGTGRDGVMAAVEMSPDAAITVHTNCVDMGNGSATTLAISTARHLGRNAERIGMGAVNMFNALELSSRRRHPPGRPTEKLHATEWATLTEATPEPWDNPRYTPRFASSSSACLTAFHQVHAVEQASLVLFRLGMWPAACAVWGRDPEEPGAWRQAVWQDGSLTFPGELPLLGEVIATAAHQRGLVIGAMVHAFYSGRWVSAEFQVGATRERWELDGLSVMRPGSSGYAFVPRTNTDPPADNSRLYGRSQYAPSASLIAVDIDPTSGSVRVTDVHTYLDAGRVLQPGLLSGQYQGGVAMGIGSALFENFPQEGGEGEWNLNRYHVPLAKDVPLDRIELELLPPTDPDAPAKGIAEAVLCPIAPAIANAVSHATGARFRNLPITPAQVREVVR